MIRPMNDGKDFEFEVMRLLQAMGFDAEVTGYSQDGGVDIVATNPSPLAAGKCIVQCKALARPVGEPVLRDLFGTMHAQGANKGILITTSSFTAAALRFAQGKPLELIDGALYRELCERHGLTAYGTSVEPLPDGELLDPNSTKVRIISIDCSDSDERKSMQHYVFAVGQFSIGNCLAFDAPGIDSVAIQPKCQIPVAERLAFYSHGTGGFALRIESIEEVGTTHDAIHLHPGGLDAFNREFRDSVEKDGRSTEGLKEITGKLSQLELAFTVGIRGEDRYWISLEGRFDVIKRLELAASAKMSSGGLSSASPGSGSSGCLVMLALPLALAALLKAILHYM